MSGLSALSRRNIALGVGLLIAAGIGLYFTLPRLIQDNAGRYDLSRGLLAKVPTIGDRSLGSADAPIVIIEYASATCPHCAQFHTLVFPEIRRQYIDAGKVRFIFRELPLDELAMAAFVLARCVPAEKYFPTLDLLFSRQKLWVGAASSKNELALIMKDVGLNQDAFDSCLKRKDLVDAIYEIAKTAYDDFGVRATPTFFINGQMIKGSIDVPEFKTLIEADLTHT